MAGEYAFISHESAVEFNRAIARGTVAVLPDAGVTTLPEAELCVRNQSQFAAVVQETDRRAWGLCSEPVHLIVPTAAARSNGRHVRFHVWANPVPDHAFVRVHEQVFASSPMFAVLQLSLARKPSRLATAQVRQAVLEDARIRREAGLSPSPLREVDLLAWEHVRRMVVAIGVLMEFAGTYCLPSNPGDPVLYGLVPAISREAVGAFLAVSPSSKGIMRARQVVSHAYDGSASPMETALVLMLTLPVELGGYGLPRPQLNGPIEVPAADHLVAGHSQMRADLLWASERLVVEYDSHEFHAALGRTKITSDFERANSLTALGYRVLSVTFEQVIRPDRLDRLARQIARLLGVALPQPTELQLVWRARLHALLLPASRHLG